VQHAHILTHCVSAASIGDPSNLVTVLAITRTLPHAAHDEAVGARLWKVSAADLASGPDGKKDRQAQARG
jgi:hypothetical protein